jgi:hypothetical protein
LTLAVKPPSPNGEGYNEGGFILEIVGITYKFHLPLLSELPDLSTSLRFATSCDHLWWAGKMTAQELSRTFPQWGRLQCGMLRLN